MAIRVNTKQKLYTYIPLSERAEEKPFTVELAPLNAREYALTEDILTRMGQDQTMLFTTGSYNYLIAQKGVKNWSNLLDEKGNELKPTKVGAYLSEDSLNLLPPELVTELANVILGITKDPDNANLYLGKEEEENNGE